MKPYAELVYYNQVSPIRKKGFTRLRDTFKLLEPEHIIELAGRNDYGPKSTAKLGQLSKLGDKLVSIIRKWLDMGHHSMVEFGDATFYFECSRTVLAEITRHRIASFQVESQRFTKYEEEDPDDLFYMPDGLTQEQEQELRASYVAALNTYIALRDQGVAPQDARYTLPNAMRTRIFMKANVREWRHVIKLRLDTAAQPEMRELMQQVYDQLVEVYPNALHGVLEGPRGNR